MAVAFPKVDHVEVALRRLPEQFKAKTRIANLLRALVGPFQSLEDALWQLIEERSVDTAIGIQLDQLGHIVGQERGGLSDADYRRYIRARIMTNRSRGSVEDLIRIANLVLAEDDATIEIDSQRGTAVVRIRGVDTTDAVATIVLAFLEDGAAGGVRVVLESVMDDESEMFTTARAEFLASSHPIGSSELATYNDSDDPNLLLWPASGQLVIDEGTAIEETFSYTVDHSAGPPFVLSGTTANVHAEYASVSLVGEPGEGWGDSADAGHPTTTPYADTGTTGGRMADARE